MKTISFVIPVYNEEHRLEKTFKALSSADWRMQLPSGIKLEEVIFVNDGSSDATATLIETHTEYLQTKLDAAVHLISYPVNHGKGYAVRQGMLASQADYALLFDADMSTPLSELKKFVPLMKQDIDVLVGTRKNGKSTVIEHQPLYREKMGQLYTAITRGVLNLNVTDFTCGFKAFSRRASRVLFTEAKVNRWGYDAEVLLLGHLYGFSTREQAVLWSNDARTKVQLHKDIPQSLFELGLMYYLHIFKPALTTHVQTASQLFSFTRKSATIK